MLMKLSQLKQIIREELTHFVNQKTYSENLKYHLNNKSTIIEGVFRYGSDSYLDLFEEARNLHA